VINKIILGISGKRGVGKTTLANYLQSQHGFFHVSLARALKNMVKRDFGLSSSETDGHLKEAPFLDTVAFKRQDGSPMTPRDLMMSYGQYFRSIDPNYWIKGLFEDAGVQDNDKVVISDVRFKNEADYIRRYGGYLIRINRPSDLNIYKSEITDISETDLDDYNRWNYYLPEEDNITLENLYYFGARVVGALEQILESNPYPETAA